LFSKGTLIVLAIGFRAAAAMSARKEFSALGNRS
jgi:hypothetical protein